MFDLWNVFYYQENRLLELVEEALETDFWKKHRFAEIHSREDYQRLVPLHDYSTLNEYIIRMMSGEENVLTPYEVTWFAKTAGTTWISKYLPVTQEALKENHLKCSKDFLSIYLSNHPDSKLLEGLWMWLAGGFCENPYSQEENVWFISSILSTEMPWRSDYFVALDKSYWDLDDRHAKLRKIAVDFSGKSISSVWWVGPWIVLLGRLVNEMNKSSTVRDVRPYFELILSGGVNVEPYVDQYKEVYWEDVRVFNIYNASEWFFWFQTADLDFSLLLATNHWVIYEFIPLTEFDWVHSKTVLSLEEVERWVDYALVITTYAWLWRYIIWDVIRFTSLLPFKFEITWRTQQILNGFWEQLSVMVINQALQLFKEKNSWFQCFHYLVCPVVQWDGRWYHEWIFEVDEKTKQFWVTQEFVELFDDCLSQHNHYYWWKRWDNLIIWTPHFHFVDEWTFETWMKKKGKFWWQVKIPHITHDSDTISEILAL